MDDISYLDFETIGGANLYIYCLNNPVKYVDPTGHIAFFLVCGLVIGAIGLIAGGTYVGVTSYNAGNRGWNLVGDIVTGAVVGGIIGFAIGAVFGLAVSSLLAGSFFASCGQVYVGLQGLAWAYTLGGPVAAITYMTNNFLTSININSSWLGYYPPNDGFGGSTQSVTLQPGDVIQRYGGTYGRYVAPYYTSPMSLSLPYQQLPNMNNPTLFVVNQSITVNAGEVAPWFGQYGGGIQYILPESIQTLINSGIISYL